MNVATAVFLVLLLASSSYAAGRLHGQLSYKIGYRAGYRNGYADGDRAAWLYRRREPGESSGSFPPSGSNAGSFPATGTASVSASTGPAALTATATPVPAPVGTPPDLPTVAESPPAPRQLLTPEVQRLLTEPPEAVPGPVPVPHRGRAERPVNALPIPSVTPPVNRGVVRQGTTYHAIGVGAAAGGGRHAHPD